MIISILGFVLGCLIFFGLYKIYAKWENSEINSDD